MNKEEGKKYSKFQNWYQRDGGNRKRIRSGECPEVDKSVLKWLKQVRDCNIPVSGSMICGNEKEFAEKLIINNLKTCLLYTSRCV